MSLDNTTIQHPLPGDLQARVENALNLVTSLEAEHARLERLIASKKSEVNSNHVEIKDSEAKIASYKEALATIATQVSSGNESVTQLQTKIDAMKQELSDATQHKLETLAFIVDAKKTHVVRVANLEAQEAEFAKRASDLTERENLHQKKVDRLLEAVK